MHQTRIKVLYIAGMGRSGSTILGKLLGQIGGFFFGGEIRATRRVWAQNGLCGCGARVKECDLWKAILKESFANRDIHSTEFLQRHKGASKLRYIPIVSIPGLKSFLPTWLGDYSKDLTELYSAIRSNTGCSVIVDTSKYPQYGYVLRTLPMIDLYVVHLVRDARAVAYSRVRTRLLEPQINRHFNKRTAFASASSWILQNVAAELLGMQQPKRYLRLRYEDVIDRPEKSMARIVSFLQQNPLNLPHTTGGEIEFKIQHSVAGNPSRFEVGTQKLKLDDEWKQRMRYFEKSIVSSMTWPLLLRYGYLGIRY
jgi:hypothetical protein